MRLTQYIKDLCSLPGPLWTTREDLRAAVENHAAVWEQVGPDMKEPGAEGLDSAFAEVVVIAQRMNRNG